MEKLAKPRISEEFITFWLHRFRKLDVTQKSHRKMLIDTFINAIFLYDDKLEITFNFKEGTKTVTFAELQEAVEKETSGSDMQSVGVPENSLSHHGSRSFLRPFFRRGLRAGATAVYPEARMKASVPVPTLAPRSISGINDALSPCVCARSGHNDPWGVEPRRCPRAAHVQLWAAAA